jgi:tetratricopeptide (TPR) repeat protein
VAQPADFSGTSRFRIVRRLGAGGMGVVYEAIDVPRGARIALKTLRARDPQALLRFKAEFRALTDLRHPNLVSLGELIEERGTWFFTMELLEGTDFLSWVRPGATQPDRDAVTTEPLAEGPTLVAPPDRTLAVTRETAGGQLNAERLRHALRQLAGGLRALHAAGMVHRDVKPSNVFVTPEGRVVLLDFGLVMEAREEAAEVLAGTVAYMAPEQATSRAIGPAADWYAVGAMLYEALTGRLPFDGSAFEVIRAKQTSRPIPPVQLAPDAPADLSSLCMDLLAPEPAQRPDADAVLGRLGVVSSRSVLPASAADHPFVGREREQEQLLRAWDTVRRGRAVTVYVHGESGVGKTALVRRFAGALARLDERVLVLAGRCYERESVPYKAVDGIIDALARALARLPREEVAALLPAQAALLAQIFPVLARVEAVATAPRASLDVLEPTELRHRVFVTVRELLGRVAERFRPILLVDDLQWADADSLALLRELVRPPSAPPLLVVATIRTAEHGQAPSSALASMTFSSVSVSTSRLHSSPGSMPGDVREIHVQRLGEADARALAAAIAERVGLESADAERLAREAQGHPLFIDALVRHASLGFSRGAHLEDALWARVEALPPEGRALVVVAAVAGTPLPQTAAARAAGVDAATFDRELAALRAGHVLRTTRRRGAVCIEPYHDRIRQAVLGRIPEDRTAIHENIARALEDEKTAESELLATHWHAAGQPDRAARYAIAAAEEALASLAFDRAARLLGWALELAPSHPERPRLLRARADAFANAGRGRDAARTYLQAAELTPGDDALELRRRAAANLLMSGHLDEGRSLLSDVLRALDLEMPATGGAVVRSILYRRTKLALRGASFTERAARDVPPRDLLRIDVCWSAAVGLGLVDPARGAHFQLEGLLLALAAGEPHRIARSFAMEAAYVAAAGRDEAKWRAWLDRARSLAKRIGDPYALALTAGAEGLACYHLGAWERTHELCDEAARLVKQHCVGVSWELDTMQVFSLYSLAQLGRFGALVRILPDALRDAEDRGDLFLATELRTGILNAAWLAVDDVAGAHAELDEALRTLSTESLHLQHAQELSARVAAHLYDGDVEAARRRLEAQWDAFEQRQHFGVRHQVAAFHWLRGRLAVALAARKPAERAYLLKDARRCAKVVEGAGLSWTPAAARLLRAGAMHVGGDRAGALAAYARAEELFSAASMDLQASIARLRRGELMGGDEGKALRVEAEAAMRRAGIIRPERMALVFAPT